MSGGKTMNEFSFGLVLFQFFTGFFSPNFMHWEGIPFLFTAPLQAQYLFKCKNHEQKRWR